MLLQLCKNLKLMYCLGIHAQQSRFSLYVCSAAPQGPRQHTSRLFSAKDNGWRGVNYGLVVDGAYSTRLDNSNNLIYGKQNVASSILVACSY